MKIISYSPEWFSQVQSLEIDNLDCTKEQQGFLWLKHDKDYFKPEDILITDGDNLVAIMCLGDKDTEQDGYLEYQTPISDDRLFVTTFVIHEDYRRQGIATKLFNHLFISFPTKQILLEADTKNYAGNEFYKSIGMKPSTHTVNYDNRDWVLYSKNPQK